MKQKTLIILSSLFILTSITQAQMKCSIWSEDFGNEQNARIATLRAEERYYNIQYQVLNKPSVAYRDVVLMRQAAHQLGVQKTSELQITRNKCFTRTERQPMVYTRICQ
jgi:hypothetical protein